ncbi:hypothetical protein BS47DRAFT_1368817 [Hydnum rufescens UP504]|uniref:Uncharacterized protein n=1 Tax=Hydnum rufescens UP504 TaxID=1448309 RepID=A0A9P6AET7_9AGAM|nr:hypothetical protein BS47DRAFT_1368817 [Hydnum rufescens UP504]
MTQKEQQGLLFLFLPELAKRTPHSEMTTRPAKRNPGTGTDDAMRQDPRRTTHPLRRVSLILQPNQPPIKTCDTCRKNMRERKPTNEPLTQTTTSPRTQIRTRDRGTNEYHTPTEVGIKSRLLKRRPTPTDTPPCAKPSTKHATWAQNQYHTRFGGSKLKPPKQRPATRDPQLVQRPAQW